METIAITIEIITKFAWSSFAGSYALSGSLRDLQEQARAKILAKLQSNPLAAKAIATVETGSEAHLELIAAYLKVAMYEDPEFASEIQAIAQEVQGEMPQKEQDVQHRGNQTIVSASGGAFIGSIIGGVPGAITGAVAGSAIGWLWKNKTRKSESN